MAFAGAHADRELTHLGVAGGHVVPDRPTEDVRQSVLGANVLARRPDHRGDLELVIESIRVRRPRDLDVGADHRVGHSLVVGGHVEPLGRDVPTEAWHDVVEMPLERQEVAQAARSQRGEEPPAGDRRSLPDWRAGLDERDHVAVEPDVDDRLALEQPDARAAAGLVGDELHGLTAAARCTASRIFR